jgi:hypothetical protein
MAAGKFTWYTRGLRNFLQGDIDLANDVITAYPVSDGYTPATGSHSILSQVIPGFQTSASGSPVAGITLTTVQLTQSGTTTIKFTADNLDAFSQGGDTMQSFKYLVIADDSASGGVAALIGFIDMDTSAADASVGQSTQVTVTWPAAGIGKLVGNP